jgi:hypothetical protein
MHNKPMSHEEEQIFLSNTPQGKQARQQALDKLSAIIETTEFDTVEAKLQAQCEWAVMTTLLRQIDGE